MPRFDFLPSLLVPCPDLDFMAIFFGFFVVFIRKNMMVFGEQTSQKEKLADGYEKLAGFPTELSQSTIN